MACTHTKEHASWAPESEDDWGTVIPGHWCYETVHTTEDIDTGRFRCTQCGEVMYYTGLWKDFYEKGIPCAGSDRIKVYESPPPVVIEMTDAEKIAALIAVLRHIHRLCEPKDQRRALAAEVLRKVGSRV